MNKLRRSRSSLSHFEFPREDRIQVAIRARPLNSKESGNKIIWKFSSGCVEELKDDGATLTGKRFSYDNVFGPGVTTPQVYESLCKAIIEGALEGYNGTIFAYGQTSSGKTFTLLGSPSKNPGISLLAIDDVFRTIQYQGPYEWAVHASYLEIYNETITDLLQQDPAAAKNMKIYEDKKFGYMVKNITEVKATSSQDCVNLLMRGEKSRHYTATGMNDRSSRSHTIFQLRISSKSVGGGEQDESLQKMRTVVSEFAEMQRQIDAEHATLYIVDQEHQELHSHAGDGVVNIPISQGLAGACALEGKTLNIEDVHSDPRFNPEYDERTGYSCCHTLIVPIKSDSGEILAVAQCINKKQSKDAFTEDDETKAEKFAECVSPLIKACKSNVRLSRLGVLNIVDLAGSERVQKTASTGTALKEAGYINKSLSTLGSCINILAEGKPQHVPFRDSKLTILLSGSLGGNARTAIICAISPATRNRGETMSTLQFANRAKRIINKVQRNTRRDQSELVHLYMTETEKLRSELGHIKVVNKWQVAALKASLDIQKKRHSVMIESLPAFRMSDEMRLQLSQLKNSCSEAQTAANVLTRPGAPRIQLNALIAADGDDLDDMRLLVEVRREGLPVTWMSEEDLRRRLGNLVQMQANNSGTMDIDVWEASSKEASDRPEPIELVTLDSESDGLQPKAVDSLSESPLQASSSEPPLEPKASSDLMGYPVNDQHALTQKLAKREEPTLEEIQRLRIDLAAVMSNLELLGSELAELEAQKKKPTDLEVQNKKHKLLSSSSASVLGGALVATASTKRSSDGSNDVPLAKLHGLLQKASSLLRNASRSTSRTSRRSDDNPTSRATSRNSHGTQESLSPHRMRAHPGVLVGASPPRVRHTAGASPPRVRHTIPCVVSPYSSRSSSSFSWSQVGQQASLGPGAATTSAPPPQRAPLSAAGARPSSLSRTTTPIRYMADPAVSLTVANSVASGAAPPTMSSPLDLVANDIGHLPPAPQERSRAQTAIRGGSARGDSSRTCARRTRLNGNPDIVGSGDVSPVEGEFVSQLECLKKELDNTLEHIKEQESRKDREM